MDTGMKSVKDWIEVIAWIIGAGSLAFTAYTYYLNKKQLSFSVIISCTERFQAIMATLKSSAGEGRLSAIKQYVDLCNEELFYFKNKYLPDEVVDEWLDGMVYYLPHFNGNEDVNQNPDCLKEISKENLLADYPRVKDAFTVNAVYKVESKSERRRLIERIKKNLKRKSPEEA
jgi:hypothetical protein